MNTDVRIILIDDDPNVLDVLADGLSPQDGYQVVGRFCAGLEALKALPVSEPDIVLLDVRMPSMDGMECLRRIQSVQPDTKIIMISGVADDWAVFHSYLAGAHGYLAKPILMAECFKTIQEVIVRGVSVSPDIAPRLATCIRKLFLNTSGVGALTRREREILNCISRQMRDKEIASELCIAPSTVHTHMHQLFKKLGVNSREEALRAFLRW